MYIERTLKTHLLESVRHFPIVLLTGARQVGKTTFLKAMADESRTYISLDDPRLVELARTDPALFMQRFPGPVLIDEIQYAPELLPHIKMAVDAEHRPGRFWLTGSQQFHLMRDVSESLAGRVGIIRMLGLSRREQDQQGETVSPFLPSSEIMDARREGSVDLDLPAVYQRIWKGTYPALTADPGLDRDMFYSSYVQTYVQRDVRDLAKVGDETAFLRFVRACAARTAQLVNMADLARDAGVAPNTAKSWLSILEASGLVYLLEPYHTSVTKRLVKSPKLYFLDTGLCSWLTEWTSPETLEAGAASGAMFETWVIGEILRSWWHNGKRAPLYFYRDKDRKEIDLLIIQDARVHPIEIKKTATPDRRIASQFGVLDKLDLERGEGGVVCLAGGSLPLGEGVVSIPAGNL